MLAAVKRNGNLKRAVKLAGVLIAGLTLGASLVGAVWAAAVDRSAIAATAAQNRQTLSDLRPRLREVERSLERVATDVRWIRETMEREEKARRRP